ncbi:restriction endonuclease (plasmid) [Rhizobium ruizarguesonis]|nr:restriction endonuclease [Rhizobium ruizarguesonis]
MRNHPMHNFDKPFFKRLRPNDTPENGNNQGGFVLPRELERFFPEIEKPSAINHAPGTTIRAALFIGTMGAGIVDTRYHYQSWGGKRIEPRITGELGAIRNHSKGDDFLLMERSLSDPLFYRLTLHRAGTPGYDTLLAGIGTRRWGPVDPKDPPLADEEVAVSEEEQKQHEKLPFELFDNDAALHESHVKKVARSKAFSRRLLPIYDFRCAMCGNGHAADKTWEVEAAHIVPRGLKGADDARNGLVLCKSHHWAFDQGLFGIRPDLTIVLRPTTAADPRNAHLLPFDGKKITLPQSQHPQPSPKALAWHLENVARIV